MELAFKHKPLPGAAVGSSEVFAVRRGLAFFTLEGIFANVFIILTGGAFLTGLALFWGANDFEIGLLGAMPFLAQAVQILSAYLIDRTGRRKSIVLWSLAVARQIWWLILPLLFMTVSWKIEAFLVIAAVSWSAAMAAMPGWMTWIADVVPERIRARYLGSRNTAVAVSTIAATLLGGIILDLFRKSNRELYGFAVIIGTACIFALIASYFISRISDRPPDAIRSETRLSHLLKPLRVGHYRHLLSVFLVWNIGIGISAAFFAPHMLNHLGMDFTQISIYACIFSLAAIACNKYWGKLIDSFGSKPVAVFCAFAISMIPLVWLFPRSETAWILMFEAIYAGGFWAGFNLAAFTIPIANSPKEHRTSYLAMFSVVTGLGFFAASVTGGIMAVQMYSIQWYVGSVELINYHVLFLISSLLRMGAAALMLTFHEPREKSVPVMINFMGYAVLKRLSVGRQIFPFNVHLKENHFVSGENDVAGGNNITKAEKGHGQKEKHPNLPQLRKQKSAG